MPKSADVSTFAEPKTKDRTVQNLTYEIMMWMMEVIVKVIWVM